MRIIAGQCKGMKLLVPKTLTRPSSDRLKGSLFSAYFPVTHNQVWLDLFAGSGAIGLEALSRGADWVYFNEKDKGAYEILKTNISKCSMDEQVSLYQHDAGVLIKQLMSMDIQFDVIYCDPPYQLNVQMILDDIEASYLLKENGLLVIEQAKNAPAYKLGDGYTLEKERVISQSCYRVYRKGSR